MGMGVLGHRAGVDDNDVGGFGKIYDRVTAHLKRILKRSGLRLVQPAAEGVKRDLRFRFSYHFF